MLKKLAISVKNETNPFSLTFFYIRKKIMFEPSGIRRGPL